MNTYTVIFGFLLCTVIVNARHFGDRTDREDEREENIDSVRRARERGVSQMRHRRRSYQMNYGYDYPQPPNPYYPDNRREYDRSQDLMPQILRLLDEISAYVKHPAPPPPPQPIYVPYPVPYPVPQYCNCPTRRVNATKPVITSRFPAMEDTNQNWGFVDTNEEVDDDSNEYRPISFTPIVPKQPEKRTQPRVDHGSNQAGSNNAAQIPTLIAASQSSTPSNKLPGTCDVFSLSCCNGSPEKQRQCFNNVGCSATYDNGKACSPERVLAIIDAYSKAYSPVN